MLKTSYPSADISAEALQDAIDLLRRRERRWGTTGSKRALQRYLASAYGLYATWKRAGVSRPAIALITRLTGLRERKRHPIRSIIDATCTADRRSKSRWAQALRYAWRERDKWPSLTECLSANGGIAGCAGKWADIQAENRTPPGCVRVGGEDRFPKIPLFVEIEMLDGYGGFSMHP